MAQQFVGATRYAQATAGSVVNANFTELYSRTQLVALDATTANVTFNVPAGYMVEHIGYNNTTANAVTGGVRVGTTSGGADVVSATPVAANGIGTIPASAYGTRLFSTTAATTLYLQAVTAWNSASVGFHVVLRKLF